MKKIKCAVVDDEHLALSLIGDYLQKIPQLELVASCSNGMETIHALQKHKIDLLFLDIQLPDIRGVELLRTLPNKPLTIFTTAYPDYAIESYDLQAVDYLLKPIEFDRFVKAVNKATEQMKLRNNARFPIQDSFIIVKADHGKHKIYHKDIIYLESLHEYIAFHTIKDKKILTLMSLAKLEETLPGNFLRIHRSYIVNIDKVSSLYGNQVVLGDVKLPIGRSYKENTLKRIF